MAGTKTGQALLLLMLIVPMMACHHRHRNSTTVRTPTKPGRKDAAVVVPVGYTETGVASWYGVPYHGRAAADGEIYDMETLVAAHRTLPFNTWLRVTNLTNNATVDVRIIDRGPFVSGRSIDLSKAAARQIGLLGPGTGKVRYVVIAAPAVIPEDRFYAVQVGSFAHRENAERLRNELAQQYGTAQLALKQGATPLWRVLVGKETSVAAAGELATVLGANGKSVFVVRLDESEIPQPSIPDKHSSPDN